MISLVPVEWKDWKTYMLWINRKEIMRLVDRHRPVTAAEHRKYFLSFQKDKTKKFFSVIKNVDSKFIGVCSLKNIDKRNKKAELFICIGDKSEQGKGWGKLAVAALLRHAFDKMGLNRVYLYTPEYNRAALKCYRSVGFVNEGCSLQDIYRGGRYYDSYRLCYLKKFRDARRRLARRIKV